MEGMPQEGFEENLHIVWIRGLIIADDTMKTHWLGKHPNTVSFSSFFLDETCLVDESMNQWIKNAPGRSRKRGAGRARGPEGFCWGCLFGTRKKNSWIDQLIMTWEYYFYVHMNLYGCYLHVHVSATSWCEMIVSTILGFWWNLKKRNIFGKDHVMTHESTKRNISQVLALGIAMIYASLNAQWGFWFVGLCAAPHWPRCCTGTWRPEVQVAKSAKLVEHTCGRFGRVLF